FNWIVAVCNDLLQAVEGRALRGMTSKELARFFWEEIICRYKQSDPDHSKNPEDCYCGYLLAMPRLCLYCRNLCTTQPSGARLDLPIW
ncbi:hypothetical protein JAAARDRAFT_130061, partial [Jaapia argillacea MUCL 33604]